jgi:hypothetical protein
MSNIPFKSLGKGDVLTLETVWGHHVIEVKVVDVTLGKKPALAVEFLSWKLNPCEWKLNERLALHATLNKSAANSEDEDEPDRIFDRQPHDALGPNVVVRLGLGPDRQALMELASVRKK